MSVKSPPAALTEEFSAPIQKIDPAEKWRRLLMWPSVVPLLLWMIVPLAFTIYFSFIRYNLLNPANTGFAWFQNYQFLVGDASFSPAISQHSHFYWRGSDHHRGSRGLIGGPVRSGFLRQKRRHAADNCPLLRTADRQRFDLEKHDRAAAWSKIWL